MIGKDGTDAYIALASHKLSNMLKSCWWQNVECSIDDFKPILDGMTLNQCYAFNANDQDPLYTNLPGLYGALRLRLNIEQYEYVGLNIFRAGVTIAVLDEMVDIYTSSELAHHISAGRLEVLLVYIQVIGS